MMLMPVEYGLVAASPRDPAVMALVSAYLDLAFEADPLHAHDLAASAARLVDVPRLIALGRAVHDPLPWRVFMTSMLAVPATSASDATALQRLYECASEMLRQQGASLVRPEDCLAYVSPLTETIASIGVEH